MPLDNAPPPPSRADLFVATGASGLRRSGGYVLEEFLPALSGLKAAKTFKEMRYNDPTVGAIMQAITSLIRQATWDVRAADQDPESEDAAEFVRQVLFEDMQQSWDEFIADAMTMLTYGFAVFETIWKYRRGPSKDQKRHSRFNDGMIGIRRLAIRRQESIHAWYFDEEDEIQGIHQQPFNGSARHVHIDKLLLLRTTPEGQNPEGYSILRNAYRAWLFKSRMEDIEGVGVERNLVGLPVMTVPPYMTAPDASDADRAALVKAQQLVSTIRRGETEGVVLPAVYDDKGNKLYDLSLLNSGGQLQHDTSKIIDRYDRRIAMSVLADFLFLGQQAVGSFALSSDKTELFSVAIGVFLSEIEAAINRVLIPRLWALNGLPERVMPKLCHGDVEAPDLSKVASFISALAGAGMQFFPDPVAEDRLREMAGLPPLPEGGLEPPPDQAGTGAADDVEDEE